MRRSRNLLMSASGHALALAGMLATVVLSHEAIAQYSPRAVVDGEPTPDACRAVGFDISSRRDERQVVAAADLPHAATPRRRGGRR